MKNFQTMLELSETNKPTTLHNEKTIGSIKRENIIQHLNTVGNDLSVRSCKTGAETLPVIAARWLHSRLRSFQTVSVVPQTNKQQSMHDADTLSIHVHIISPAHRDQCCQQVSLCHHRFGITTHCTSPPYKLQNVDHSLPLSGSPGMASRIVSQAFSAPVT